MNLTHPTTVTFVIYMVAMVAIGFAGWRRTRNLSDYLYEMIPGIGLACLAVVLGSLLDRPRATAITDTFRQMRKEADPEGRS